MIDLILHSPTGAGHLRTWASSYPPANPLLFYFEATSSELEPGGAYYVNRRGFEYVPWNGSGRFMTDAGSSDVNSVYVAPTYLPGYVALCRIHASFFDLTKIESFDVSSAEQWHKNTVAKYIRDNGALSNVQSIPYYEFDGVRVFRPQDVRSFCSANSLTWHEWLGGNKF